MSWFEGGFEPPFIVCPIQREDHEMTAQKGKDLLDRHPAESGRGPALTLRLGGEGKGAEVGGGFGVLDRKRLDIAYLDIL